MNQGIVTSPTDSSRNNPSLGDLLALQKVLAAGDNAPAGVPSPGSGVGPGGNGGFGGLAVAGQQAANGIGLNPATAAGVMGITGLTGPAIGPVGTIGGLMNIAQNLGILGPPNINPVNAEQGRASIAAQGYHANTISNPVVNSPEFNAVVQAQHGGPGAVGGPGMGLGGVEGMGGEAGVTGDPSVGMGIGAVSPGDGPASAAAADGGVGAPSGPSDGSADGSAYYKGGMVHRPAPGATNPPGPDDQYGSLKTGERVLSRHEVMMLGGSKGIEKLLRKARG